jgi:hypothetical protein
LFLSVNGYKNGVINSACRGVVWRSKWAARLSPFFAILSKPTPDRLAWRSDVPAALVRLIEEMLVKEREGRMSLGDALPGCMRQVAAELDKIRDSV